MSRIFWDTNLFIYLLEKNGPFSERVFTLRERMIERGDELCTSTMTLGEILVWPLRQGHSDIAQAYEEALSPPATTVLAFDRPCARRYAQIRQDRSIQAPDAIQLACAAQGRCDMFITNDDRLSRKVAPGIQFIVSLERAPL